MRESLLNSAIALTLCLISILALSAEKAKDSNKKGKDSRDKTIETGIVVSPQQLQMAPIDAEFEFLKMEDLSLQLTDDEFKVAEQIDVPVYELIDNKNLSVCPLGERKSVTRLDYPPKAIKLVRPVYPRIARIVKKEGLIILRLLIDQEGKVSKIKVLKSLKKFGFDQAAISAVRQWRFKPPVVEGKPVMLWYNQPIMFKLK